MRTKLPNDWILCTDRLLDHPDSGISLYAMERNSFIRITFEAHSEELSICKSADVDIDTLQQFLDNYKEYVQARKSIPK